MAFEIKHLLPAAIISTVGSESTVSGVDLFEAVQSKWAGPYSVTEILEAVEYLSKIGDVAFLDISNPEELIRINGGNLKAVLRNNSWRETAPASYNWVNFGDAWLKREWDKALSQERRVKGGSPAQSSLVTDVDSAMSQLVPASDREVRLDHNSSDFTECVNKLEEAQKLIAESNQLTEEEKKDTLVHLDAGLRVLRGSTVFAVGTMRYLVLDRLKAAFEGAIEDAFKAVLVGAFMYLAALLIGLL